MYKLLESGNGTKISDRKRSSAKTKISRTKDDKRVLQKPLELWIPSDCNDVCFQQISENS